MSVPDASTGLSSMCNSLRSTKRPVADLTWRSSAMSWSRPKGAACAAGNAHSSSAAVTAVRRVSAGSLPEVMEVEPIEGRIATIRFEPRDIAGERALGLLGAAALGIVAERQALEKDIIALTAAVHAEHQHDRALQQRRHPERPKREGGRRAEEVNAALLLAVEHAVGEDADEMPGIEPRLRLDQRARPAESDDVERQTRIDGVERRADLARVFLVHDEADTQIGLLAADRAHHLEAAEMRAEEQAARALLQDVAHDRLTMHGDVVAVELVVEQEDAVERAGGEAVIVAEDVDDTRPAAEDAAEIVARRAARAQREDEEIAADRIEQQARRPAAETERHPDDEADGLGGAALAPRRPLRRMAAPGGHGATVSSRTTPLSASRSGPSRKHSKRVSPVASLSQRSASRSPGRTGWRNLAERTVGAPALRPSALAIASTTSSSSSAPGMIGLPGKCPARVGWSGAKPSMQERVMRLAPLPRRLEFAERLARQLAEGVARQRVDQDERARQERALDTLAQLGEDGIGGE